jgi:hypothetical protein
MNRPSNSSISPFSLIALTCCAFGLQSAFSEDHHDHVHAAPPAPAERRTHLNTEELAKLLTAEKEAQSQEPVLKLPPLPEGVEELSFQEFYKNPVGPRGLEPSTKLLSLNGKRVRVLGFVAEMELANKRNIILAPLPLKPQPEEYGLADEIPAAHILVTIPGDPSVQVPFQSGPLLLAGTITVGNSTADGETSFVRMVLDAPAEADAAAK